jgi:YD repeat-containing protein
MMVIGAALGQPVQCRGREHHPDRCGLALAIQLGIARHGAPAKLRLASQVAGGGRIGAPAGGRATGQDHRYHWDDSQGRPTCHTFSLMGETNRVQAHRDGRRIRAVCVGETRRIAARMPARGR